jgi:CheY-like chemotaxis protein
MNANKPTPSRTEEPMRTSGSWAKSNERVLVIADSDEMRELLVDILSSEGFVTFDQPSAIGATRSIRQNAIRAVVVDVGAPGIRGEKVVSVLRENPRLGGLVIVVVTGDGGDQELEAKGLESANAILDRASLALRLAPILGRLLRNSSYRPLEAFSAGSNKT